MKIITLLLLLFLFSNSNLFGQSSTELFSAESRNYPIIPFNTNFWNYWDHYWTTWLDDHPKYEAIELTAFDNPEHPDYKLIRVFLSEKDGAKRQFYYLNDSASVARSQANTYLRDITYERSGEPGSPQNLYVKFRDKDDELIEWNVQFTPDQELRNHQRGLTPSIHSVGLVLLYHLRTKTINTNNDEILFNGTNYAYQQSDKNARQSWYNNDVYSAVIIFGKNTFNVQKDAISNNRGRTFKPSPNNARLYKSNELAKENFVQFKVDDKNQIEWYEQISFGHSFNFTFNPALPNYSTATDGQIIDYSASFDDYKRLMKGQIRVSKSENGLVFSWQHLEPEWATWRSFKSIIEFNKEGYQLTTYE